MTQDAVRITFPPTLTVESLPAIRHDQLSEVCCLHIEHRIHSDHLHHASRLLLSVKSTTKPKSIPNFAPSTQRWKTKIRRPSSSPHPSASQTNPSRELNPGRLSSCQGRRHTFTASVRILATQISSQHFRSSTTHVTPSGLNAADRLASDSLLKPRLRGLSLRPRLREPWFIRHNPPSFEKSGRAHSAPQSPENPAHPRPVL